jgi:hypothetical protein
MVAELQFENHLGIHSAVDGASGVDCRVSSDRSLIDKLAGAVESISLFVVAVSRRSNDK